MHTVIHANCTSVDEHELIGQEQGLRVNRPGFTRLGRPGEPALRWDRWPMTRYWLWLGLLLTVGCQRPAAVLRRLPNRLRLLMIHLVLACPILPERLRMAQVDSGWPTSRVVSAGRWTPLWWPALPGSWRICKSHGRGVALCGAGRRVVWLLDSERLRRPSAIRLDLFEMAFLRRSAHLRSR